MISLYYKLYRLYVGWSPWLPVELTLELTEPARLPVEAVQHRAHTDDVEKQGEQPVMFINRLTWCIGQPVILFSEQISQ